MRGTKAKHVNVHQAKTELSKLLAEVEQRREIVIARNGTPVARLVPLPSPGRRRLRVNTWKGRIEMAADFDAPLTDAELAEWGL
jgi:prevent-host-death family protein